METNLTQLVSDRLEIADTLHRYAFGLDHNDADALASAFTADCTFDFTPAGAKLGLRFAKLNGRDAVVKSLISLLGPLDTSHTVSNLQVKISGDSATASAARDRERALNESLLLRARPGRPEMALESGKNR